MAPHKVMLSTVLDFRADFKSLYPSSRNRTMPIPSRAFVLDPAAAIRDVLVTGSLGPRARHG